MKIRVLCNNLVDWALALVLLLSFLLSWYIICPILEAKDRIFRRS